MPPIITAYLIILGFTTCVLQIFFRGSCAYCHILEILKIIGFKKSNSKFWEYRQQLDSLSIPLDVENFTFDNAIEFISSKNKWIGQLLSCPYCLSWHLTFWSLLITAILAYTLYSVLLPIWFFALTIFTVPYLSNFLLQRLN